MEIKVNGDVNPTKGAWIFLGATVAVACAKGAVDIYVATRKAKLAKEVAEPLLNHADIIVNQAKS